MVHAVQLANSFLQERLGRGGYNVITTISNGIHSSLPDGSVSQTFEHATTAFGSLLQKAGGVVSSAMNTVTETVTETVADVEAGVEAVLDAGSSSSFSSCSSFSSASISTGLNPIVKIIAPYFE
jgi:phage-related protein